MKTRFEPAAGGNFLENRISNIEFMNENNNPETKTNSVPLEESLQDWLADSIPAWNQLLSKLNIKRQIKKHKPTQGV